MINNVENSVLFFHRTEKKGPIEVVKFENDVSFNFSTDENSSLGIQMYDNINKLVNADDYMDQLTCYGSFKSNDTVRFIYSLTLSDEDFEMYKFTNDCIKISTHSLSSLDFLVKSLFHVCQETSNNLFGLNVQKFDSYQEMFNDKDYDIVRGLYSRVDFTMKYLSKEVVITLPIVNTLPREEQVRLYMKPYSLDIEVSDTVIMFADDISYSKAYSAFYF